MDVRNRRFDVSFNNSFPQMHSSWDMSRGEFAFFSHVDQVKGLLGIDLSFELVDGAFANARADTLHQCEKPGCMLLGHKIDAAPRGFGKDAKP